MTVVVAAVDTQGIVHIFDKPTPFDPAMDPFLYGMARGKKEAIAEVCSFLEILYCKGERVQECYIDAIKKRFGLEI